MTRDVKFDVFHFHKNTLRHIEFTSPSNRPSFHDLVSQINLKCDPENKLDLHYLPILYTDLNGEQVVLNNDPDSLEKFYTVINGQNSVHLEVPCKPYDKNEDLPMEAACVNKLNLQDLENLFKGKVDIAGSREIQKVADIYSATTMFRETAPIPYPGCSKTDNQESLPQKGMLFAKCISGEQVSRLLKSGSPILFPGNDNNFVSLSFSKDHPAHPAWLWLNRSPEHFAPRYQCERVGFPTVIGSDATILVSDEFEHILRVCKDNYVRPCYWQENLQSFQQQALDDQIDFHKHFLERQNELMQKITSTQNRMMPMMPLMLDRMTGQMLQDYQMGGHPGLQKPPPQQNQHGCPPHNEDCVPTWFQRHMKNFKKELIADVENMLQIHAMKNMFVSEKHDSSSESEEDTPAENSPSRTVEKERSPSNVKETVEGWEVVTKFPQNDSNSDPSSDVSACSDQPDKLESDKIPLLHEELEQETAFPLPEHKMPESSKCIQNELSDSDSSISLMLDDSVENYELADRSDVIEIPGCFVKQQVTECDGGPVLVRVKRHVRKSVASEMIPEPKAEIISSLEMEKTKISATVDHPILLPSSEMEKTKISATVDHKDDSNPQREQGKAFATAVGCSNWRGPKNRRQVLRMRKMRNRETDREEWFPVAPLHNEQGKADATNTAARCPTFISAVPLHCEQRKANATNTAARCPTFIPAVPPYCEQGKANATNAATSCPTFIPVVPPYCEPGKVNATNAGAGCSTSNSSDNAGTENARPRHQTQPVNILHDKVFEMTNTVFKNVLNSVKMPQPNEVKETVQKVFDGSMSAASRLIPNPLYAESAPSWEATHFNEVKESMQKVFEESMSAASRFIPNPLYTESVPPAENLNFSSRPQPGAFNNETSPPSATPAPNANESFPGARAQERDDVSKFDDLSDKVKANLILLNEMGFVNNGHNLFLLSKYPDDIEKVVESLVNFGLA